MLRGVITAIITPMKNDGTIDFIAFEKLIEFQIKSGVTGIVVIGSTGEFACLELNEKIAIIEYAIKVVNQRIKVIVGVGSAGTSEVIKFIESLNTIKQIDYIMALTPSYVRPTQEGLYQHFASLSKSSNFPIIMYNVPSRTGCNLEDNTAIRLANNFSNIVGLKDATGNIARCSYLVKHKPQNFWILSGDDATAMAFMLCGGDGVISVVSNLVPKQFSNLASCALNGKSNHEAIKFNNQIIELHSLMFIETNPIPIKWALFHVGLINTSSLRLPLTVLTKESENIVKPVVEKVISEEKYITQ